MMCHTAGVSSCSISILPHLPDGTMSLRRYGGHNVVLEIQACMPSPPKTFRPYMRGVYIAYIVVSWAYFGVAFTGEPCH